MRGADLCKGRVFAVLLSLLAGCSGLSRTPGGVPLRPSPDPYELDIPLPDGFRLVDEFSGSSAAGLARRARHRYRGPADKQLVRRFYRTQMPLVRWTLRYDRRVDGHCLMRCGRGSEACTVTIDDSIAMFRRWATVDVVISPAR